MFVSRVEWLEVSGAAAAFAGTWVGPSLPRLYGKEPPPPPGLPTSGPPGARPAIAVPHSLRNLRPLSSLCKGRPGTEQPVPAYHRPSCPGAHHYLPPPISRWAVSLRIPPHPAWAGQAHRTAWLEPIPITGSPQAEGGQPPLTSHL